MNDYVIIDGELYHYGVLGMKWGVHRAKRKQNQIRKLESKAVNYDKRSAKARLTSEKKHAIYDLKGANRKAIKAAKLEKKAANISKQVLKEGDAYDRSKMEKRAEELRYKAAKANTKAEQISKSTPYGKEAMKYSVKSDKLAAKAAKARKKIASDQRYLAKMNRKISSLTPEELEGAYAFCKELLA